VTAENLATEDQCQLVFGQVRHSRLRPSAHSFVYPAFFLRVPVHALSTLERTPQSAWFGINKKAALSFFEKDHGDQAKGSQSNWVWITTLLQAENLEMPSKVWLHAFSRVFGYSFKPVSFWFCHRADNSLIAIVAEVNNTFGERHIYLLMDTPKFGQSMQASKVFHVSPFCAIEGHYTFRFLNTTSHTVARVDHSDNIGPLLLTSLSGELHALTNATIARALLKYPLFTFGVVARIHLHALRLWLKRVPFFSKPEPPSQLISTDLKKSL
jgi:uncharacterized protein